MVYTAEEKDVIEAVWPAKMHTVSRGPSSGKVLADSVLP